MKMQWANAFHNAANIASALLAMLTAGLLATGCIETAMGSLDCAGSWLGPKYTAMAIAAIQLLKTGVNIARDGFSGLWKPQPPVKQ